MLTAQTEIPAKGHTEKIVKGKAAGCTEAGLTDGVVCETCGEVLTAQTEIPAKGHTDADEDGLCDRCRITMGEPTEPEAPTKPEQPTQPEQPTEPAAQTEDDANRCKYCGRVHTGFFGAFVRFFHRIAYFFAHLFGRM